MPPSAKSESKATSRTERTQPQRRHPIPRLNAEMPSDAAFRVVARRCLAALTANSEATCSGDQETLHQMRIELTRLRTALLFFSPMVADAQLTRIREGLRWLNGYLGAVRDLDVAIERLGNVDKHQPRVALDYLSLSEKRANNQRLLTRGLRSARYRRLVKSISGWIDNGPWSIKTGTQAANERGSPITMYSANKLTRWQEKLLKKGRKLLKMSPRKRHRLRLLNKKLSYSIEFFGELLPDTDFSRQHAALKYLRKAQRSLGQLNDDANSRALASALKRDGIEVPLHFLTRKREKHLIRTAAAAYQKLAKLEPLQTQA
jgi:CHAD domain-containing protein